MRNLLLTLCLGMLAWTQVVRADLVIDVVGGRQGGQPIAIVPFGVQGSVPIDIASIITNDLQRTGKFDPLAAAGMPQQPIELSQVNLPSWQATGTPHLVIGRVSGSATGGYTIEFQLVDIFKGGQMVGLSYNATSSTLRQVAHKISDVIYQTLLGERGIFSTRIAYVTVRRGINTSQYKLYVADADGANPQMMLDSNEPVFSPAWSPDGQRIAYVSLEGKQAGVYIQEVSSGRRSRVAAFKGINSAPSWSPDGTRLAMTLSRDGNPEIYVFNLSSRSFTRMTNDPAIDTEPEWTPDGSALIFTSDRTGGPQIYRMSAGGGGAQRLTFSGNYNARPRVSPDGTKLLTLHNGGHGYQIAVMDLTGGQMTVLSDSSLDESPSFAPNGSMVIYGTGRQLAAVSIDGRVHQRLAVQAGDEVREPAWSPFLD
ncbi:Tol-Pal system beta propeller repeat protein TolB [Beggiatoa leptomitoformis]|nr:Tol-Pal system beta propeller repeat protein TolB [Beggiatoa leptomitoformis]